MDTLSERSYKCVTVILRACKPRNIWEVRPVRTLKILSLLSLLLALMEQLGDFGCNLPEVGWCPPGTVMIRVGVKRVSTYIQISLCGRIDLCLSRYWSLNNSVLVNSIMCFAYTFMSLIFYPMLSFIYLFWRTVCESAFTYSCQLIFDCII